MSKKKQYFYTRFRKNEAYMVVLAQLAEHRIVVTRVVGSPPLRSVDYCEVSQFSSPTFHPQTSFGMSFLFHQITMLFDIQIHMLQINNDLFELTKKFHA